MALPPAFCRSSANYHESGRLQYGRSGPPCASKTLFGPLLRAGSPAVNPVRAFDHRNPAEMLRPDPLAIATPGLSLAMQLAVSAVKYVLLVAPSSISLLSFGRPAVHGCSRNKVYVPAIWLMIAPMIHICGAIALVLRVRIERQTRRSLSILKSLSMGFKLNAYRPESKLV